LKPLKQKHPVPNPAILAKALFRENSYLIPEALHQSDWATQDFKMGGWFAMVA